MYSPGLNVIYSSIFHRFNISRDMTVYVEVISRTFHYICSWTLLETRQSALYPFPPFRPRFRGTVWTDIAGL